MDKYARFLAGQGQKISPEDSDYKEKLIHVVQSFRTFDEAAGLLLQSIGICEKLWQKYIILAGTMKNARLFLHCWRLK